MVAPDPFSRRHRLPRHCFATLASGFGDAEAIASLRRSERSWRLLLLRNVLDRFAGTPHATGPLAPLDEVWALLVRAQLRDRGVVDRVLSHPQTGIWAAYSMRLGGAGGGPPLWIDLGYLHSLAAAAAVRAGLDFELAVPARDGVAMLPTLGSAELPGRPAWGYAVVRADGGRLHIDGLAVDPSTDSTGWDATRRLSVHANGLALQVELNDLDPFRDLQEPTGPQRLRPGQAAHWATRLEQAWELLTSRHAPFAEAISAGLSSVVPLPHAEPFRALSASGEEAFGSVLISEPDDPTQLAATLVHEFQHNKLGALLHTFSLYDESEARLFYAPWRDDPRPIGGMLQGSYAFTGVTEFWRAQRRVGTTALADFEFSLWRAQTRRILRTLRQQPAFTELGLELLAALDATLGRDEPVPAGAARMARLAATDHAARWRAHHLAVDTPAAAELADLWTRQERPPARMPEPYLRPDPAARWLDSRAVLIRHRMTDPGRFQELGPRADQIDEVVQGARPPDVALIGDDLPAAQQGYERELETDPTLVSAWIGLAWTVGRDPAARALLARPELVLAVAGVLSRRGVRAAPLAVASWLGTGLSQLEHSWPASRDD